MKNSNLPTDEMPASTSSSSTKRTIVALTAGAVAGAVTALLLAPQSGKETRAALANGTKKVKSTLTDTIQSGIDKLSAKTAEVENTISNSPLGRK